MKKKYQVMIIILGVILVIILSLAIIIPNNDSLKYKDDNYGFNYSSNFSVSLEDGSYIVREKEGNTEIIIRVLNNDYKKSVSNEDKANLISKDMVTEDYEKVSANCLDTFCMNVYENDEKHITITTRFMNKDIYVYRLICDKDKSELYNEDFDLIINSFVKIK